MILNFIGNAVVDMKHFKLRSVFGVFFEKHNLYAPKLLRLGNNLTIFKFRVRTLKQL